MITYFKNIWDTYFSILEGMAITLGYLFQKPVTVQYPDRTKEPVWKSLPQNYRGRLQLDLATCTGCALCAKACPIDVIDIKAVRTERKKGLTVAYFNIYHGKCMYCNFCVEACPAEGEDHQTALTFKKNFEGAGFGIKDMIEQFVPPEESRKILKEGEELAAKRAAAKASEEKKPEGDQS
jgi:NADH-quinone oxidoreductase subunit I